VTLHKRSFSLPGDSGRDYMLRCSYKTLRIYQQWSCHQVAASTEWARAEICCAWHHLIIAHYLQANLLISLLLASGAPECGTVGAGQRRCRRTGPAQDSGVDDDWKSFAGRQHRCCGSRSWATTTSVRQLHATYLPDWRRLSSSTTRLAYTRLHVLTQRNATYLWTYLKYFVTRDDIITTAGQVFWRRLWSTLRCLLWCLTVCYMATAAAAAAAQ